MDILTALDNKADYSSTTLQGIIAAWVMSKPFQPKAKISTANGDVAEEDYTKQSIYSLLYAIYRSTGDVSDGNGQTYEFTFNTWGIATGQYAGDPQRFGKASSAREPARAARLPPGGRNSGTLTLSWG